MTYIKLSEYADSKPKQAVEKPADILARLQKELELVGYVTSHTLQSPLRSILSTCEELEQQIDEGHKTISAENAQLLVDEAKRLKAMMQAMVEYIQLETHAVEHVPVDCGEVLDMVLGMLSDDIKQANATITYDPLPIVFGHYGRLSRLFAYLIDNALKFRSEQEACRIHIGCRKVKDMWEFSVHDNGIGITPDDGDVIFKLFKRLHTQEAYPGYGTGLAFSRKIVESHGGILGVESESGKGCRFYFTLPTATQSRD